MSSQTNPGRQAKQPCISSQLHATSLNSIAKVDDDAESRVDTRITGSNVAALPPSDYNASFTSTNQFLNVLASNSHDDEGNESSGMEDVEEQIDIEVLSSSGSSEDELDIDMNSYTLQSSKGQPKSHTTRKSMKGPLAKAGFTKPCGTKADVQDLVVTYDSMTCYEC